MMAWAQLEKNTKANVQTTCFHTHVQAAAALTHGLLMMEIKWQPA
jgi:hypothetical protein